ncbi:MAG: methionyl-tRNA formyltransferase, partial [Candidatus Omnitrophota bacterium]
MKIVFFGSSDFSIPSLEACLDCGAQVSLVLTTPDRRKGRGLKELPTPVKLYCRDKGVPVISPESLKVSGPLEQVRALEPDLFVAASYGKIIPAGWLKVPKARLNVHPSLLPKYRGAAPVQWALLNGDALTGVSIMDIHERLDAGDIYLQKSISLDLAVNAEELTRLLAELSRVALAETLRDFSGGRLQGRPQNEQEAVYARKLEKSDGLIDWAQPALRIHNQVRGLAPWPGAFFRDSS